MDQSDYSVFLEWLTDLAACLPNAPALDRAALLHFKNLEAFSLGIVEEALWTALRTCDFFPAPVKLLELARDIKRARYDHEQEQHTQRKLLAYEADTRASGLSPAENQAFIAELLAVVGDSVRLDHDRPPEPRERQRPLHPAYTTPITNDVERKRFLRDQLAQVSYTEEAATSA